MQVSPNPPSEPAACDNVDKIQCDRQMFSRTNEAVRVPVETQETVCAACEEHYPGEDLAQKFRNLLEEVAELGCVLGVSEADMIRTLTLTVAKSDDPVGDPAFVRKEVGDVGLSILNLAGGLGIVVDEAVDEVTGLMRTRGGDVAAARVARKRALGLR